MMKIIMASKPSSCILDPIPTKLLKEFAINFAINFEWNNAELSGVGHRVYGLSSANDFPFIFVHFRGVFPYIT